MLPMVLFRFPSPCSDFIFAILKYSEKIRKKLGYVISVQFSSTCDKNKENLDAFSSSTSVVGAVFGSELDFTSIICDRFHKT